MNRGFLLLIAGWLALVPLQGWSAIAPFEVIRGGVALKQVAGRAAKPSQLAGLLDGVELSEVTLRTGPVEPTVAEGAPGTFRVSVPVEGSISSADTSILSGYEPVPVDPKTLSFKVPVDARGPVTPFALTVISVDGTVKQEEVQVVAKDWASFIQSLQPPAEKKQNWSGGLSLASLSYSQTGKPSLSQMAIGAKVDYRRKLPREGWSSGANIYGTVLPLSTSIDGVSLSQVGVNLRAGRAVWSRGYKSSALTTVSVFAGGFYTSTVSSNSSFGFKNLMGLQIYPEATHRLDARNSLVGYFKFAPLFGFSLTDREFALGASWARKPIRSRNYSVVVDYSDISFETAAGTKISSRNLVLGVSLPL